MEVALGIFTTIIFGMRYDMHLAAITNMVTLVMSTAIYNFLAFDIKEGKSWTHIVFTILAGLGILSLVYSISLTYSYFLILRLAGILEIGLKIVFIVLLFYSKSTQWFDHNS